MTEIIQTKTSPCWKVTFDYGNAANLKKNRFVYVSAASASEAAAIIEVAGRYTPNTIKSVEGVGRFVEKTHG